VTGNRRHRKSFDQVRHVRFTLIATDLAPTELPPGLTREEVTAKLAPPAQPPAHTKGVAGMVGLFVNPWHE